MNDFEGELAEALAQIREQGLYRELRCVESAQSSRIRIGGKELLNFSSNDYLGLSNDPVLKEATIRAVERYGAGAGASRLICGSLIPHHELENALAEFKSTQAALTFSTGYGAAQGAICSLLGNKDTIVADRLVHASIIDAAYRSGAKIRVFRHNDLNDLEKVLQAAGSSSSSNPRDKSTAAERSPLSPSEGERAGVRGQGGSSQPLSSEPSAPHFSHSSRRPRILIVTESVFSMDGDHAPLREIVDLKDKYGAWLMVDEAHATGLYGPLRTGIAEENGVADRIEIQMGTLGKAIGASGGYIAGSEKLVAYLVNTARTFVYSTAPVPAAAASALAGIRFIQSDEGEKRRRLLWDRVDQLATALYPCKPPVRSAIVPVHVGNEIKALAAATSLRECGYFIPAIRYPTVGRGKARLRVALTAGHTKEDVAALALALKNVGLWNANSSANVASH